MVSSHFRRLLAGSFRIFPGLPVALVVSLVLLAGCHPAVTDPKDPKFVVAEKGNWKIFRADLDNEVATYLKEHQATAEQVGPAKMPMLETAMLDNMILKKLLLDKAATMQFTDVDKEEAAELDALKGRIPPGQDFDAQLKAAGLTLDILKQRIHEKVLIENLLKAEAFKNVDPTDQEINDIYVKNKASFNIPPKVRASRILITVDDKMSPADKAAKKKAIDAAHDRVSHGEDFSKVAMEVSQDRYSAPRGGDVGFFQRNENEPGFDDVAFNTKVDTLSPVFQTQLGYQFLKVTAVQPGGIVPVADARDYITKKLRQVKMGQQEEAYTKKLLADANVTYHITRMVPPPQPPPANNPPTDAPPSAPPAADAAPAPGTPAPPPAPAPAQ